VIAAKRDVRSERCPSFGESPRFEIPAIECPTVGPGQGIPSRHARELVQEDEISTFEAVRIERNCGEFRWWLNLKSQAQTSRDSSRLLVVVQFEFELRLWGQSSE
jgi:hypothetical protein